MVIFEKSLRFHKKVQVDFKRGSNDILSILFKQKGDNSNKYT